jgi:hypothetical protein
MKSEDFKIVRKEFCKELLKIDEHIKEIIQFGSSVYAPRYANSQCCKDIDVFIFTERKKNSNETRYNTRYSKNRATLQEKFKIDKLDIFDNLNRRDFLSLHLYSIFGFGEVIHGSGAYIRNEIKKRPPTSINVEEKITRLIYKAKNVRMIEKEEYNDEFNDNLRELYYVVIEVSGRYLSIAKLNNLKRNLLSSFERFYKDLYLALPLQFRSKNEFLKVFNYWHKEVKNYIEEL